MSALWDYMSKQHGLNLLESEIDDILTLARQEIELPSEEEYIESSMDLVILPPLRGGYGDPTDFKGKCEQQGWLKACKWYENKVRNPYPKTIRFIKDDEEFDGLMEEVKRRTESIQRALEPILSQLIMLDMRRQQIPYGLPDNAERIKEIRVLEDYLQTLANQVMGFTVRKSPNEI